MAATLKEKTPKLAPASTPRTPAPAAPKAEVSGPLEWFNANKRLASIVGGAVAVILLGAWFLTTASKRKEEFANRALNQARNIAESGNFPLASGEFQKIIDGYHGSDAAKEAEIALNQLRLINGQSELVVVRLRGFLTTNPGASFATAANALLGAALENSKRPAEAAAAYQAAADAASLDYLKAQYLLEAGRAYTEAGRPDEAAASYRKIMTDYSKTTLVTEAEVRLAELTKGKM